MSKEQLTDGQWRTLADETTELEIPSDAQVCPDSDGSGAWVQAWVYVSRPEENEDLECDHNQ